MVKLKYARNATLILTSTLLHQILIFFEANLSSFVVFEFSYSLWLISVYLDFKNRHAKKKVWWRQIRWSRWHVKSLFSDMTRLGKMILTNRLFAHMYETRRHSNYFHKQRRSRNSLSWIDNDSHWQLPLLHHCLPRNGNRWPHPVLRGLSCLEQTILLVTPTIQHEMFRPDNFHQFRI